MVTTILSFLLLGVTIVCGQKFVMAVRFQEQPYSMVIAVVSAISLSVLAVLQGWIH
jgi:hypothetical protein